MDTKKHVSELLPVYMDGMCTAEEIKAVAEHLSGCDQCRRDLADLQKTVKLVGSLRELEPPEGLWEGIEKKIRPRSIFEIFSLKLSGSGSEMGEEGIAMRGNGVVTKFDL